MEQTVVVTVKPGSGKGTLVETADDGSLMIYVREPAIEGTATESAARLLAQHLGVLQRQTHCIAQAYHGAEARTGQPADFDRAQGLRAVTGEFVAHVLATHGHRRRERGPDGPWNHGGDAVPID
ncbi:hypothetical protein MSAR_42790 [Mycolicibacterium sarraceniae]|uniref:Uncharacterized protein n=1 Tax=Mycolicibacterium sarraceniae TaxID=1534348 RepID=A0A7I7SWR1_9MYCO|nr:hypothetical protein MSAR_42790 [Mycolicibacterium sarraceniae]